MQVRRARDDSKTFSSSKQKNGVYVSEASKPGVGTRICRENAKSDGAYKESVVPVKHLSFIYKHSIIKHED